jgi:hypothetical protein
MGLKYKRVMLVGWCDKVQDESNEERKTEVRSGWRK